MRKWWVVWGGLLAAAVVCGLYLASRAETWVPVDNRRLPARRYLDHPPQYFPPSSTEEGTKP